MNNNMFPGIDDRLVSQCSGCNAFFTVDHLNPVPSSDTTARRKGVNPSGTCPTCHKLAYPIVSETLELTTEA